MSWWNFHFDTHNKQKQDPIFGICVNVHSKNNDSRTVWIVTTTHKFLQSKVTKNCQTKCTKK